MKGQNMTKALLRCTLFFIIENCQFLNVTRQLKIESTITWVQKYKVEKKILSTSKLERIPKVHSKYLISVLIY